MLEQGSQAPNFSSKDQNGNNISLSDFLGKWVAFFWYPKASTPGWALEASGFRVRTQEFENANAVIIGASFDSVSAQLAFAQEEDFPFALIADETREVGSVYFAERTPEMKYHEFGIPRRISYLINPQGIVHKSYDLEESGIELSEHAEEVLQDIIAAT